MREQQRKQEEEAAEAERRQQMRLMRGESWVSEKQLAELDRIAQEIAEQRAARDALADGGAHASPADSERWALESNFDFYERLSRSSRFVHA